MSNEEFYTNAMDTMGRCGIKNKLTVCYSSCTYYKAVGSGMAGEAMASPLFIHVVLNLRNNTIKL